MEVKHAQAEVLSMATTSFPLSLLTLPYLLDAIKTLGPKIKLFSSLGFIPHISGLG